MPSKFFGDAGPADRQNLLVCPALEIKELNAAYSGHQVLFGIDVEFYSNTITAIMGPSGCGKSTLISSLNRTLELVAEAEIISGSIFLEGQNIYDPGISPEMVRKRIGMIFQRPLTFPMSIIDNVLFGAQYHQYFEPQNKRDFAMYYLEIVGLKDELVNRLDEPASKLSGGQQQRLCLARTLANQPKIILMDEPCSALDPVATRRIEDLMRALSPDYTIIIVTHNMAQAKRVSSNALLMHDGRIVEAGTTEQLFNNPETELLQKFVNGEIG